MKKMIMMVGVTVVLIMIILLSRIYYLGKVTTGEKIDVNQGWGSALLVLDIQEDTLEIKEYQKKTELMANINQSIQYAKGHKMDVIYIQQLFKNPLDKLLGGGRYQVGTKGAELSSALKQFSEKIITKERNDAFSNKDLDNYLQERHINQLYLVGADASACVYKTALGGVNRGYHVTVLEDCLFSLNQRTLTSVIEAYQKNDIEVMTLADLIKE